jgi:uncharacterized protein YjdB
MSVENNQDLIELKEYAQDIGVEFASTIGYDKLKERVEAKEIELAEAKRAEKKSKNIAEEKVKIIVNPRDGDANIKDQFFGFNGKNILIQFDEEIEVDKSMYEFIKGIGGYVPVVKVVTGEDGMPKKEWSKKYQSRFLVEKVD